MSDTDFIHCPRCGERNKTDTLICGRCTSKLPPVSLEQRRAWQSAHAQRELRRRRRNFLMAAGVGAGSGLLTLGIGLRDAQQPPHE